MKPLILHDYKELLHKIAGLVVKQQLISLLDSIQRAERKQKFGTMKPNNFSIGLGFSYKCSFTPTHIIYDPNWNKRGNKSNLQTLLLLASERAISQAAKSCFGEVSSANVNIISFNFVPFVLNSRSFYFDALLIP